MRLRAGIVAALVLLTVAACSGAGGPPAREPDTTGVVGGTGGGAVLVDSSDAYFEGMSLVAGDPGIFSGTGGDRIPAAELAEGDAVEVWVEGPCAESYPVQCEIEAVRRLDRR